MITIYFLMMMIFAKIFYKNKKKRVEDLNIMKLLTQQLKKYKKR